MQNLEPLVNIKEICRLAQREARTIYRWHKEAQEKKNNFPLPVISRGKLLWNRKDIIAFLSGANPPTPQIESAKSRQMRHAEAMAKLEQHGVKVARRDG